MWVTLSLRKKELKQEHAYYQLQDLQISRQKRQLDRRKRYEQSLIQLHQKQELSPIKQAYEEKIAELDKNKTALKEYLSAVKNLKKNSFDNYILEGNDKNKVYIKSDGGQYIAENDGAGTSFYNINNLKQNEKGEYYEEGLPPMSPNKNSEGSVQRYQLAYDLSEYTELLSEYGLSSDLSSLEDIDVSQLESTINGHISSIELDRQEAITDRTDAENSTKAIWEDELEMLEDEVGDEETQLELEQNDIETQMEYVSTELQSIGEAASQDMQQNVIQLK